MRKILFICAPLFIIIFLIQKTHHQKVDFRNDIVLHFVGLILQITKHYLSLFVLFSRFPLHTPPSPPRDIQRRPK